jgi:hypothetical protein
LPWRTLSGLAEHVGMSARMVLVSAGFATACGLVPLAALESPASAAASGGDATVVVSTLTVPAADDQGMATVMCPAGTRAIGGGAAPSPPLSLTADLYRIYYSAPVDAAGTASTTSTGDVPRGWQVTVGAFTGSSTPDTFKAFVVCSAASDAVLASDQPGGSDDITGTATCPSGSRAIGGGMGKINDDVIPGATAGPIVYETGPVDSTGTVAGTQEGDVATGWRTVAAVSSFGNRFFAVCSAASDAVVRSASYTLAAGTDHAGGTAVSCPAGTRALSGGQATEAAHGSFDRVALMGPFASPSELAALASGAVGRAWSAYGQSDETQSRTYRVFALCGSDAVVAPPADVTPPDTTIENGPGKQTASTKAKLIFSSEAGATFTCKLDKKPARACTSPFKVKKLEPGKHKVTVTATDAAGNADPTPATYTWKVKKKVKPPSAAGCTGECRSVAGNG